MLPLHGVPSTTKNGYQSTKSGNATRCGLKTNQRKIYGTFALYVV